MRAENEARRHSRATLRYQLIVDVLQIDRAPAPNLCLDLLPLIEEPQANRIFGGAVFRRRGRSGEVGDDGHREQRSENKHREMHPSGCSLLGFGSLHTRPKWRGPDVSSRVPSGPLLKKDGCEGRSYRSRWYRESDCLTAFEPNWEAYTC